uniref:Uncharacterized protein n=1 Tax=Oncorhynchus tshawytscha TaxID=74940 RepID=A0AAZ3SCX3_ONCTS
MHVWPCAVVLAHVWTHREELMHKTVKELGAGMSLPGVVAAKCGAQCLENCRHTCEENELPNVLQKVWGDILGSDIFYEPEGEKNTEAQFLDNLPREKICLSGPVHDCQSRSSKH